MENVINSIFKHKYPHIGENVSKAFTLYKYFVNHIDDEPDSLVSQVTENGKPLFTRNDIQEIQTIIRKQKGSHFFTRLQNAQIQHGGFSGTAATAITGTAVPTVPIATVVKSEDPSRNKFFDKLIRKLTYFITDQIPPSWDGVLWYVFLLNSLEHMDVIGPFIATALDTVTLSLPIMAELTETVIGKLLTLVPLPYVGFGGELIGHALGLIFIIFAVFLNISRKQFGSAFKVSLEAIPIFGDTLMDAAQSVETGVERYLHNRGRLLNPIATVSPHLHKVADYWAPDVEIHRETMPVLSMNLVKADVADYVTKEIGVDKMMNKVNPSALVNKASKTVTNKVNPIALVNKASKTVTNNITPKKRSKTRKYKSKRS